MQIVQAREYTEVVWAIYSLDLILGLVGGFTGIIWMGLGLMIAPYEDFKFQASLIGSVYPCSPQKDADEAPCQTRDEAE